MVAAWCLLPYALNLDSLMTISSTCCESHVSGEELAARYTSIALILAVPVVMRVAKTPPSAAYNRYLAIAGLHLLLWTALFTFACL